MRRNDIKYQGVGIMCSIPMVVFTKLLLEAWSRDNQF